MKTTHQKEPFLNAINSMMAGVSNIDTSEQSAHLMFTGNEILSYNDRVCIVYPFESEIKGAVKARDFQKIIADINEGEFEISDKNDTIIIQSDSTKAKTALVPLENTPLSKIKTLELKSLKEKFKPLPIDFIDGVKLCLFSAQNGKSGSYLECINVQSNHIMSSDNYRISYYKIDDDFIKEPFLINLMEATKLVNFNPTKYYLAKSWVHFSTEDDIIISTRRPSVEYKTGYYSHFEFEGVTFDLPSELKNVVNSLSILCEAISYLEKSVDIVIDKNKLIVKAQNAVTSIEKILPFSKKTKGKIEFSINPIFLTQILDKATTVTLAEDRALFETDKFKHLIGL